MVRTFNIARRALGLALALALAMPVWAATPAMAAGEDFVGGPIAEDMPLYIANDHTPQAIRFNAGGLTPNTAYEVKIRLSPNMAPAGNENRGFTWNPTTNLWVQNRGPVWGANNYPTVTTDASGNITQSPWFFFKFGNEGNSGTYYIIVTLNSGGEGTAQNAVTKPAVTVLDMKADGTRVHTGALSATTAQSERRAIVAPSASTNSTATIWSATRTEANLVDDDSNGVVDDEDMGLLGSTGDYLMAAPASSTIDVWVQQNRRVNDAVLGGPDESIALGAQDKIAPTKPAGLTATPTDQKITLAWDASTDASGVVGYKIYRWENVNSVEYTPVHTMIGTTTETSFEDTSTTLGGVTYNYEVRAIDAATNVSAASVHATATSTATSPVVSATVAGTPGTGGWFKKGVTPKVTISTAGTAKYVWNDPAGTFLPYSAPLSVAQGTNTLYYYAVDAHGNESAVQQLTVKYDSAAPVPTLSAPTFSTDKSASSKFLVTWGSSDTAASSPFSYYEFELKSADGTFALPTTAKSVTLSGVSGKTYSMRVRARDAAGNVSNWTTVKQTTVPYDNGSMSFAKSGKWRKSTSASLYRGSSRYTSSKGATAKMSFKGGKSAYLIATTGPTRGKVKVYVDGKYVKTVSLYSKATAYRKAFHLKSLKGSGTHKVTLVASPTSTRKRIDIDGLAVKR